MFLGGEIVNVEYLKLHLLNNTDDLENLLEHIGLSHIKNVRDEYISCGFIDSKRKDSIQIFLDKEIGVKMWSRNTNVKDIIGLVQYQLDINFAEALKIIGSVCNIKGSFPRIKKIDMAKKLVKKEKKKPKIKVLSEKILDGFIDGECKIFTDDGIDYETQKFYGVKYDPLDNRVVFPIRDYDGNLVSIKGRTLKKDFVERGIPKYLYYYNIIGALFLFNYYEHYFDILDSEYLIIVESEKSCLQLHGMGIYNVVATSKKRISEEQAQEINDLGKKIVLAYDNDVTMGEIKMELSKLNGEVYYIKDTFGLLEKKDSPSDKGYEVWNKLYQNKFKLER